MIVDVEDLAIGDLKPHPRNYREHPEDQLRQLVASIKQHGLYRNIVVARDNTILAGHGIAQAARAAGLDRVRVARLDIEPESPQALKVLAGDNETTRLAIIDDRALTELLKEVKDLDALGLEGTGFDDMMLANLVMVTRPASEIGDHDEAAEWVGMPDYIPKERYVRYIFTFPDGAAGRREFAEKFGFPTGDDDKPTWSGRWPEGRDDLSSVGYKETK